MIARNDGVREELLRSKSFLTWSSRPSDPQPITVGRGRNFIYQGKTYTNLIVDERHYAPADLSQRTRGSPTATAHKREEVVRPTPHSSFRC